MLNVQGNKLKALPAAIGTLPSLQSLILQGVMFFLSLLFPLFVMSKDEQVIFFKLHTEVVSSLTGNDLRSLPPEIGNLKSLRTLNVSENSNLPGVPPPLAHVRTLEVRISTLNNI